MLKFELQKFPKCNKNHFGIFLSQYLSIITPFILREVGGDNLMSFAAIPTENININYNHIKLAFHTHTFHISEIAALLIQFLELLKSGNHEEVRTRIDAMPKCQVWLSQPILKSVPPQVMVYFNCTEFCEVLEIYGLLKTVHTEGVSKNVN